MDFDSFDAFIERIKQEGDVVFDQEREKNRLQALKYEQCVEEVIHVSQLNWLEEKVNEALEARNEQAFIRYSVAFNGLRKRLRT